MKVALLLLVGAAAIGVGGVLPEAGADVIRRAMYINSGGKPVYSYVFQADRRSVRSWRRGYDYSNCGYGYPYYFGSSYSSYSSYPSYYYPVHSYTTYPVYRSFRGFGGHHGFHHGYFGGFHGHAHGAFSVGGLRVHVGF